MHRRSIVHHTGCMMFDAIEPMLLLCPLSLGPREPRDTELECPWLVRLLKELFEVIAFGSFVNGNAIKCVMCSMLRLENIFLHFEVVYQCSFDLNIID